MNKKKLSEMTLLELLTFALVSTDPVGERCPLTNRPRVGYEVIGTINSPLARRLYLVLELFCRQNHGIDLEKDGLVMRIQQRESLLLSLFWQAAIEENPLLVYHPNRELCRRWTVASPDLAMFRQEPELGALSDLIKRLAMIVSGAYVPLFEMVFPPVIDTDLVLGSIKEDWVKSLFNLVLIMRAQIPPLGVDEVQSPAKILRMQYIERINDFIDGLALMAIADIVPAISAFHTFFVRGDWRVVVNEADQVALPVSAIVRSAQGKT